MDGKGKGEEIKGSQEVVVGKEKEEARRRGRPSNVEMLARGGRERSGSTGSIEEMWKRKREEEEWVFERSRKTERSPEKEEEGGLKEILKGIKEELREVGKGIRQEIADLRKEMMERERKWREEKEELERKVEGLERGLKEQERNGVRLEELEKRMEEFGKGRNLGIGEGGNKGIEEGRIKAIERQLEEKEREERRRNIIIKGLEKREGMRAEVEELLGKQMELRVGVVDVKELGQRGREEKYRMVLVKLRSEEEKREIMREKNKLRGRKEKIQDDLTWRERKMQFRLNEMAREEQERGRRVRVGYGKIWIEGIWWKWNEEKEELISWGGRVRGEEGQGEGEVGGSKTGG